MPQRQCVLATRNQGKIREFSRLLDSIDLAVLGLDIFPDVPEVEETGASFAANALLKARAVAKDTGLLALADDSGLVVDALDGAPGIFSARYSATNAVAATDMGNVQKLLRELVGSTGSARTARFCCVIAAALPDGTAITAEGQWEGCIAQEVRGVNGFGYDPIFIPLSEFASVLGLEGVPDAEYAAMLARCRTAAELLPEEKDAHSHRAVALQNLLKKLPDFL